MPEPYRIQFADKTTAIVTTAAYYVHVILDTNKDEYIPISSRQTLALQDIARIAQLIRLKYANKLVARWRLGLTINPVEPYNEGLVLQSIATLAKEDSANWKNVTRWLKRGYKGKARRYLESRFPWLRDMSSDMWDEFLRLVSSVKV